MVAQWNVGKWNVDRWATLSIEDLLLQAPSTGGRLVGRGDWRLVLEILLPQLDSGLWGLAEWTLENLFQFAAWDARDVGSSIILPLDGDVSVNYGTGTWTPPTAPTFVAGYDGRDAISTQLGPVTSGSLDGTATRQAVAMLVYVTADVAAGTTDVGLWSKGGATNGQGLAIYGGQLRGWHRSSSTEYDLTSVAISEGWHTVGIKFGNAGSALKLFIDGEVAAQTASMAASPTNGTGDPVVGDCDIALSLGSLSPIDSTGVLISDFAWVDDPRNDEWHSSYYDAIVTPGISTWALLAWQDITDRLRGMEWARGSDEVYGRPRVGRIRCTLDDNDGQLNPWSAPSAQYLAPGTILRCGLRSPTGIVDPDFGTIRYLPQWTGIVESWDPIIVSTEGADRFVELSLNETLRDLAQVDDPALSSSVGANEGSWSRIERLLDAASWRYGRTLEAQNLTPAPTTNYGLQATDMAQNRIAECYLVADSSDTQFRSLRDGRAALTASEYITNDGDADPEAWPLVLFSYYDTGSGRIPAIYLDSSDRTVAAGGSFPIDVPVVGYRPETFRSKAQDVEISNAVTLQRVGGVEQTFRQEASIVRYGQRSFVRRDLLNKSGDDAVVALLAQYVSIRRALATLRIEALTIDTWARPEAQFRAVISVEPGDRAIVYEPLGGSPRPYISGYVASIVHRISPRVADASVVWETDIRVDTRTVVNVPGAQLPATPA